MTPYAKIASAALTVLVAGAGLFWLCRSGPDGTPSPLLDGSGVLRIGYAIEAPHAFLTPDGLVTGQSPELAKRLAEQLGVKAIEWRLADFGSLIPELEEGRIDVIAAGMFITPERARRIAFSEPVFHVRQGLLVAAGNPRRLHGYAQLPAETEVRVAVLDGSIEAGLLRELGLPESRLVPVPDAATGRVAVETGLADALALSSPTILWMARRQQLGKTEIASPFEQYTQGRAGRLGYGAFAFRKTDRELLAAWNRQLRDYLRSPGYEGLMRDFGFTPEEYPGSITTKELLSR